MRHTKNVIQNEKNCKFKVRTCDIHNNYAHQSCWWLKCFYVIRSMDPRKFVLPLRKL